MHKKAAEKLIKNALSAIDPTTLIEDHVAIVKNILSVGSESFDLNINHK